MGNLPQRVAGYSCCGSKTTPEQKDIDMEISESHISYQTKHQRKQRDENKNKPSQQRLQSIPEETKLENYLIGNTSFNFAEWIKQNELMDIEHIFIKYKMTTVASLSNETNSYRNFISDTELRTNYAHLMANAVNCVSDLNVKYKTNNNNNAQQTDQTDQNIINGYIDPNLIKQQSLELCTDDFGNFIDKKLKKIINKLWAKLDRNGRGYIESVEDIAEGIGFVAILYIHRKKTKPVNIETEKQQIQKQANCIAIWVCSSYGELSKNTESDVMHYKCRVTKSEFQAYLPEWIREYAKAEGTT